ncbi:MAG: HEAT repeat domain-containing protein [Elusimicrobia bacterium]|nr:HEAT repeat domain-containing protein [Elusimicrobiota bacterium]
MTDINGAIEFNRVEGMYEGQKPTDPLWKMLESRQPGVKRKITGVKGGSVVVFAPRYGAFNQPFGIKDNADFQKLVAELGITPEAYAGWLGPGPEDWNYKAVLLDAKQLQKGLALTVKVGKVSNPEHPLASFQPDVMWLTAVASSRQTGGDVAEKKQIYDFFRGQMEYAARVSSDPFYREELVKLADPDNEKAFIDPNRGLTAEDNHDTTIHEWLTQKALELLPKDYEEPKQYAAAILEGVKAEDDKARFYNHFYNPNDPQTGYEGNATALKWGAIGYPNNPDNEWDWEDAQRYYREGDKEKAYKALGHVLHLLEDMSCPLHTRKIRHINHWDDAAKFEAYFSKLAEGNANTLPMEYSLNAEEPKTSGLKEQFDAMAKLTFGTFEQDGQKISFDNYYTWSPNKSGSLIGNPEPEAMQLMGRHLFPKTIGSGTALMKRFYNSGHPELSAQAQKKEATDAGAAAYARALEGASTAAAPGQVSMSKSPSEDPQYQGLGISDLIREAKKQKTWENQERVSRSLSKRVPSNTAEVTEMFEFLDTLSDPGKDDMLRAGIKGSIRKIKDTVFAPFFAKRMKHGSVDARREAIAKIAEFKYKAAVPDLINMVNVLGDESAMSKMPRDEVYLGFNAFDALGDIGDDRAIPVVMKKLGKLNGHENHLIGKFGLKVLPQLIEITKTSKDRREKESAYSAIGSMKDKAAIPLLWETAKNKADPYLRHVAIGALIHVTDEITTPKRKEVFEYLYSEADAQKSLRLMALGIAKESNDIAYIVRVLKDASADNKLNRWHAIKCLGEIKTQTAVSALEDALKDSDKEIGLRAANALKRITGKDYSGEIK